MNDPPPNDLAIFSLPGVTIVAAHAVFGRAETPSAACQEVLGSGHDRADRLTLLQFVLVDHLIDFLRELMLVFVFLDS